MIASSARPTSVTSRANGELIDVAEVFATLDRLRDMHTVPPKDDATLAEMTQALKSMEAPFPAIASLIECLKKSPEDYGKVRESVFKCRSPLIASYFDIPYNKTAGFEALWVEDLPFPVEFKRCYPSRVRPVNVLRRTKGFQNPRSVALFPENFRTKAPIPNQYEIFCFVDKFVERFFATTLPALRSYLNPESFPLLRSARREEIAALSAFWVGLHEYFHTTGPMPITTHFQVKATRSSAAFEELRVDLLAVAEAKANLAPHLLSGHQAELLAEFVLAERLIRYPMEAPPAKDYDARSSVAFLNILLDSGCASISDQKVTLDWDNIFAAVSSINELIRRTESIAASLGGLDARAPLQAFIDCKLGPDGMFFHRRGGWQIGGEKLH